MMIIFADSEDVGWNTGRPRPTPGYIELRGGEEASRNRYAHVEDTTSQEKDTRKKKEKKEKKNRSNKLVEYNEERN